MKHILIGLAFAVGVAGAANPPSAYTTHCSGCHGPQGEGVPGVFPPLAKNPHVADEQHVLEVIQKGLSAAVKVGEHTYTSPMPAMPQVPEADRKAIAAYLKTLGTVGAEAPQASPKPPPLKGTPEVGRKLFYGETLFEAGGLPCQACHTAGNGGVMGGGTLGKNLTALHATLGEQGLQGVLSNPAFPVMREAYKNKPFTDQEKAHLIAFFASVEQKSPQSADLWFVGLAGLAVGALFTGLWMGWHSRPVGLAERLRRKK